MGRAIASLRSLQSYLEKWQIVEAGGCKLVWKIGGLAKVWCGCGGMCHLELWTRKRNGNVMRILCKIVKVSIILDHTSSCRVAFELSHLLVTIFGICSFLDLSRNIVPMCMIAPLKDLNTIAKRSEALIETPISCNLDYAFLLEFLFAILSAETQYLGWLSEILAFIGTSITCN